MLLWPLGHATRRHEGTRSPPPGPNPAFDEPLPPDDGRLNGPTARKGAVGDRIIIFCYCHMDDHEINKDFKPFIIKLNNKNNPM